jgi:uncharacterized protein (DUF427 family)
MIKRSIPYVSGDTSNLTILLNAQSKDLGFYDTDTTSSVEYISTTSLRNASIDNYSGNARFLCNGHGLNVNDLIYINSNATVQQKNASIDNYNGNARFNYTTHGLIVNDLINIVSNTPQYNGEFYVNFGNVDQLLIRRTPTGAYTQYIGDASITWNKVYSTYYPYDGLFYVNFGNADQLLIRRTSTGAYTQYIGDASITWSKVVLSNGTNSGSLAGYTFNYAVTGISSNRLEELRKYSTSSIYSDKYFIGGSPTVDGLDLTYSGTQTNSGSTIVLQYYIGGIKYLNVTPVNYTTTLPLKEAWIDNYNGNARFNYAAHGLAVNNLIYIVSSHVEYNGLFYVNFGNADQLLIRRTVSGAYTQYVGNSTINWSNVILKTATATTTTFSFNSVGLSSLNFDNLPILKLEEKQNMCENPFIKSDVFILRQEIPVFEKSIRLRGVGNLSEVVNYAGGNYFKIFNNT